MSRARLEHDLLGTRSLPIDVYYGIHTARAVENFPLTGTPICRHGMLVVALASVKQAAAEAHSALRTMSERKVAAIVEACTEIRAGKLHDQFVVDVLQGGAGTSSNMNANEVVANRGLETMGLAKGSYDQLDPLDDVNRGQSTNDVFPTALRLALLTGSRSLATALGDLETRLERKADQLDHIPKVARTQLQDAVPTTLGTSFRAYARGVESCAERLAEAADGLRTVNLGGTAIGTGVNSPVGFANAARERLSAIHAVELREPRDFVHATQDPAAFLALSAALRGLAAFLSKLANDLRLLASGPRTGLSELRLPAVQAGSSIMPGKVNPVIPEAVNQAAFRAIGADLTVALAVEAGQLELNAFTPLIAHELLGTCDLLERAVMLLGERCIDGLGADEENLRRQVEASLADVTLLVPAIGHERAARLLEEAKAGGRSVREVALQAGVVSRGELDALLGGP